MERFISWGGKYGPMENTYPSRSYYDYNGHGFLRQIHFKGLIYSTYPEGYRWTSYPIWTKHQNFLMWNRTLRNKAKSLTMLTEEAPIVKCPKCGEESFMKHSTKGYNWCFKCGNMQMGTKNDK